MWWRDFRITLKWIEPQMYRKRLMPGAKISIQRFERLKHVFWPTIGAFFCINLVQNSIHDNAKFAQFCECRNTVGRRSCIVRVRSKISKWHPCSHNSISDRVLRTPDCLKKEAVDRRGLIPRKCMEGWGYRFPQDDQAGSESVKEF